MPELDADEIVACINWLKRSMRAEIIRFEDFLVPLDCETDERKEKLANLLRSLRECGTVKYSKEKGWTIK